jgi:GNAT superfamily N-acetyltransferase
MRPGISIRRATTSDTDALVQLEIDARGDSRGWAETVDWPSVFAEPGAFTYLAEDDETFGVITVGSPRDSRYRDGDTGEVLAWYLHPRYWQQGFGRKLLVHGLSVIKRRHCEQALIWVPETADRADASLRSLHFESVHQLPLGDTNLIGFVLDLTDYF